MAKKVITTTLDTKEVGRAIRELKAYKKEFEQKALKFMEQLITSGVEITKAEIVSLGAFDTGVLHESIQGTLMYTNGKGKGLIFTDCPWAAFVELGTGVVGSNKPHPTVPWAYDINSHGADGWVYYDETLQQFRWTKGMPSRPFMYNAALEIERRIPEIAKGVFK